jgi:hypothetical protein
MTTKTTEPLLARLLQILPEDLRDIGTQMAASQGLTFGEYCRRALVEKLARDEAKLPPSTEQRDARLLPEPPTVGGFYRRRR